MTHHHQHTGYLLGKVRLEGAIRSEVLANLVETLIQKYHTPSSESSPNNKKQFKFNEHHKYSVECSERGLKLTSPTCRSKDEGFESDSESIRSIRISTDTVELDLSNLINHLDLTTTTTSSDVITTPSSDDKASSSSPAPSSPGGTSLDSTSLSSSGLHILLSSSDDNNSSSSGNGSDSDEFKVDDHLPPTCSAPSLRSSPYWEMLPNLSSFQSYLIEDVVFCHCDALHPSTLVWVVRHLDKMIALVTTFRTRSEAEQLFQTYRELRVKLKPVKYKINPILGLKIPPPAPNSLGPDGPGSLMMMTSSSSSPEENSPPFASLLAQPTEVLQESCHSSPLFNYDAPPPKSLDFEGMLFRGGHQITSGTGSLLLREPLSRTGSNSLSLHNHVYISNPNIVRFGVPENNGGDCEETNHHPARPQRKISPTAASSNSNTPAKNQPAPQNNQPVLLVPLKTESTVTTLKTQYPKESYLYHVMGRGGSSSSSTFAPYQRSLNFLPHQQYPPGVGGMGADYSAAWGQQHQLLVPFSSWMELAGDQNHGGKNNGGKIPLKTRPARSGGGGRTVPNLPKGTTSKILLRDAAGRDSMWASLSQRFKKNVRENLIPKLNGMWTGSEGGSGGGGGGRKKRPHKKVTFNAWATVQMV
ncbi:uncharacterized protein LOC118438391 isoform X2 [Folsomia candida]|uniref:Uncharacterized protein n=2 Tax=Folsomia candida TaxID=158441 RepID=A0A226DED6_FOLCA|nr:uncharacterized protein LOC118438391 isoform X2 [Folsomia candida]OXA43945.1 hypothetical protein Fcan01_21079 [Folsomia candida]